MRIFLRQAKEAKGTVATHTGGSVPPARGGTSALRVQRAVGNHGMQQWMARGGEHTASGPRGLSSLPSVTVGGAGGERAEEEAHRVARQVTAMPSPEGVETALAGPRDACFTGPLGLRSSGVPLDTGTRAYMEPRFGRDFSGVRVHKGDEAAELAASLHARAFAMGTHIVLGKGLPPSDSSAGRQVMAHELTHVVQQRGSASMVARLSPKDCSKDCAKPDPVKHPATGKFSITVYADKEGTFLLLPLTHKVGHSWVRLEDDKGTSWTYGFWPQWGYDGSNITKDVKGCVHHPDTRHTPTASQRFVLTAAQFAAAMKEARKTCRSKPNYNLFGLQCTTFVKRVLAAAGQSFGGFGLVWDSPNALDSWMRTHALQLGTSVTGGTSAPGKAGAGTFGLDLSYRHQFYSLLGAKLRLYGLGRAEVSDPVTSLTAGAGVEFNPKKVWLPKPFLEGGGIIGDLNPEPGLSEFGAGATGSAGLRFNLDEVGYVGVEYNLVKDFARDDPVLHRFMITAGFRLF
ncbi:eCIS core domain-containing protein [Desulfoluna butyratoxydans]|uniref:eCIS core domain-containing protein n=1 Tax=Desulfoluna butyratoxydans TaxID=231438 RepID=A0A4U8YM53_9BACT|nr:DUF4157 domain-containing protein [Desulfoluna butyratoxydans]VFQ44821.1 domain of unknown function duf4157 [Desulfoluna butyratoxydans]